MSSERSVVLFDLDGTVLDSAPGIVATLQAAMVEVGLEPVDEAVLRSDLGPPPPVILDRLGVPVEVIDEVFAAYRRRYLVQGLQNASVYPGIAEALTVLEVDHRLGTATMKGIETATLFLKHHGLLDHFSVVGGAADGIDDKAKIITATRAALGDPPPEKMIMVGDRHSDISGGQANGMPTIAVTWGYGSRDELIASDPDAIIDHPSELPAVVGRLLNSAGR